MDARGARRRAAVVVLYVSRACEGARVRGREEGRDLSHFRCKRAPDKMARRSG